MPAKQELHRPPTIGRPHLNVCLRISCEIYSLTDNDTGTDSRREIESGKNILPVSRLYHRSRSGIGTFPLLSSQRIALSILLSAASAWVKSIAADAAAFGLSFVFCR